MGEGDGDDGRAMSAKVVALELFGLASPPTLVSPWDMGKSFVAYLHVPGLDAQLIT